MFSKREYERAAYSEPRAHHYDFAHVTLRVFCKSDPLNFFEIMTSEKKDDFVKRIWQKVCDHCDKKESTDLTEKDINISVMTIDRYPMILVQMPQVKAVAEAIMIAIVFTADHTDVQSDAAYRYFILEQSCYMEGYHRTVLCEWSDNNQLSIWEGPEPRLQSFLDAVSQKI